MAAVTNPSELVWRSRHRTALVRWGQKFEVITAVKMSIVVIWVVTQCSFIGGYTGLQKKYYFSVTSTKVGELNSIFYAEFMLGISQ
jgi:predicted ferric reductase